MIELGTVSHGTMRKYDLFITFTDLLEELNEKLLNTFYKEYQEFKNIESEENFNKIDNELASWAVDTLFDLLNELALPGTYFGAHMGDGSDYGYWADESLEELWYKEKGRYLDSIDKVKKAVELFNW